MTDADFQEMGEALLAAAPPGALATRQLWVFAYGSLIWKPAAAVAEQRPARLPGWHRKFCFAIQRYRGCEEKPGLMLSLDRGGSCKGMLQRLDAATPVTALDALLRREFNFKPFSHHATWMLPECQGERVPAITFVVNPAAENYRGDLTLQQQADMIAHACGNVGSCAEYLLNTVEHLEQLGIHDRYLWQLQQLVAERIGRLP